MTKKKIIEIIAAIIVALAAAFFPGVLGENSGEIKNYDTPQYEYTEEAEAPSEIPDVNGSYYSTEDVALYIHTYGRLPGNYITKTKAQKMGWKSESFDLWEIADGMCIGGGPFGNREGLLPDAEDRDYYECDVNYYGGARGEERLVYSDDGLIFYSDDHYESFTRLY